MNKCTKMYENNYKNQILSKYPEIRTFLETLANTDIKLYAMGGTAMVLANIKESTKDIDFMITSKKKIQKILQNAGFDLVQEGNLTIWKWNNIRIDLFEDGFILGTHLLDDWEEKSEKIFEIGKAKIHILHWHDICISKIIRYETRDLEDCTKIVKEKKINLKELEQRYFNTCERSITTKEKEKWEAFHNVISKST